MLSAQRLTFRLQVEKEEDGGIEPLQLPVLQGSSLVAVHSAASSIEGYLTGLEPALTGSTNQRLDHFGFRYHQWNQWELNP